MEIHNTTEDIVLTLINEISDSIEKEGNPEKLCTCAQCRMDVACYVLNRAPPHYVVSHRGAARTNRETLENQQETADITALVHEGFKRVSQIQRPYADHNQFSEDEIAANSPVFNIPTIIGRVFNGLDFAPMADTIIELRKDGKAVHMKDRNWQNPYKLVPNTAGTFTFWPGPVQAKNTGQREVFEYSVRLSAPGFEELNHFFKIPVISEIQVVGSFSMNRTFKLPDLYLFPEGGEEQDL